MGWAAAARRWPPRSRPISASTPERLGSVFLVRHSDEPGAAGYRCILLWTNSILEAARHLYRHKGYRLVAEERHRSFGNDLVGETWVLDL